MPTPIHRLDRLSDFLSEEIWIKRDDLTGFGCGGNKGRKLEYLMREALDKGAQAIVSCGAAQSNFIRQLGAACTKLGIDCHAVVMESPYEDSPANGHAVAGGSGNVRLDGLFGVHLHRVPDGNWDALFASAESVAQDLEKAGSKVFRIPVGGSGGLGAFSFFQAAREVKQQSSVNWDWIVTASSSGSTHVGLHAGFLGKSNVLGIACDPEPELVNDFARISEELCQYADFGGPIAPHEFHFNLDFVGKGYGIVDSETIATIKLIAQLEGLVLDPVYTGKAMTGLIELVRSNKLSGNILFWHTGGFPSVFALADEDLA